MGQPLGTPLVVSPPTKLSRLKRGLPASGTASVVVFTRSTSGMKMATRPVRGLVMWML